MENFKVWQRNYITKEVINKENEITVYGNRVGERTFTNTTTWETKTVNVNEFLVFMEGEFKWMPIKAFVPVGYVPDEEVVCLK